MPDLNQFPLALAYGWKAPHRDTGGLLYLIPTASTHWKRERFWVFNPEEFSPAAAEEVDRQRRRMERER